MPVSCLKTSVDALKMSVDAHKTYVDAYKTSVDAHKTSVDAHKTYVDAHKTYVDAYKINVNGRKIFVEEGVQITMSSLMKVGSLDDIRIRTGAYLGLHASDLLKLIHTTFIHLFLPTKILPVGCYSK